MRDTLTFLIVDDHIDGRYLLLKTLKRKFPESIVIECSDSEKALAYFKAHRFSAIIIHKTSDADALPLVERSRAISRAPIIVVSGADRSEQVRAAGATAFLNYDAWFRIGTVVQETLEIRSDSVPNRSGERG